MNDFTICLREVQVKSNFLGRYIEKYWYVYLEHNRNEIKRAILYIHILYTECPDVKYSQGLLWNIVIFF